MAVQQGKGQIFGLAGTVAFKTPADVVISGYITPDLQTLRAAHSGTKVDEIKGQTGEYNAFIVSGEKFECEFTYIPQGTDVANAKLSAQLPPVGSSATLTGLPVIIMGSVADVFGGVWYYQGGGSTSGTNDANWTGTFTLVRYPGITTTLALS